MSVVARYRLSATGWSALVMLVILLGAESLAAQRADFLFSRPRVTLAVTTGLAKPDESSDLFTFSREQLTVGKGDFTSGLIGGEVGVRVWRELDVMVGLDYAGRSVSSEMRDWVTQDDQPIPQTTEYERWRLTGGVKAYLLSRGRSISEYAWIPSTWAPFVGGGVGVTWYEFVQHGDFVDYQTLDIFEDRFVTDGRGTTLWAGGGVDVTLAPHFVFRAEGRYFWGSAAVDNRVFQGFEDIDLSGYRLMLGLAFRTGGRI